LNLKNLDEFLYIGDCYEKDIKNCINLNMNAFLITKNKNYKNYSFSSIESLLLFLKKNR